MEGIYAKFIKSTRKWWKMRPTLLVGSNLIINIFDIKYYFFIHYPEMDCLIVFDNDSFEETQFTYITYTADNLISLLVT